MIYTRKMTNQLKARLGLVVGLVMLTGGLLFGGSAQAVAPAYTDVPWTNDMNQASYWDTYFTNDAHTASCTKYENHNGSIPAQYDAAVTKKGSEVVRVYADLTNVGAFQATHPQGEPPMSWVMKCTFTPKATTTTSSTSTTTTSTTTTLPESTTTASSTTIPVTTAAETTTTTTIPVTTTTKPPCGICNTTLPPAPKPPAPTALPATGSENWMMAAIGGFLLLLGGGTLAVARRR